MDDDKQVAHYIEMWKQTISVQQHFNDIEWRIRGLALTALTFALGAAAVAAKDRTTAGIFGWSMQLSSVILILGAGLWTAFYFVDQVWYHPLLIGAVRHGESLESELRKHLPAAGLTTQITESSPYVVTIGWKKAKYKFKPMHSRTKMKVFYAAGGLALVLPAVALQLSNIHS